MKSIEVEVMSQHYVGKVKIEPVGTDCSLFKIFLKEEFLGRAQPFNKQGDILWYSPEITDKELLLQIGEWIEFHYPLAGKSQEQK